MIPSEDSRAISTMVDVQAHARLRKALAPAFSTRALEAQQPLIDRYIDLLIQRITENSGAVQDFMALYNWTTFDIVSDLTFGTSFGCLKDQRWHPWVSIIFKTIKAGTIVAVLRLYGFGSFLKLIIPKSMMRARDLMVSHRQEKVAARLKQQTDRPDFMSYIFKGNENNEVLSREEYDVNAGILIIAGSETTATLLSGITYLLLRNPTVMEKLNQEIRSHFNSKEEITLASVSKCEYLLACIDEALRIYPPAPITIPRRVIHTPRTISGFSVPPNVC